MKENLLISKSPWRIIFLLTIILITIKHTNLQNEFQQRIYPEDFGEFQDNDIHHRMGGAHPGYRNIPHDERLEGMQYEGNRRGMHGNYQRGHGRNHYQQNNFNHRNDVNHNFYGNDNNKRYGPFGIFSNSWFNTIYEIMMILFLISFLFNCLCGSKKNDKYALAWYKANKDYFEERYSEIGLKKDDEIEDINPDSLPIIKENQYLYKFYAAGYRYVKWLLVILEFRKRHDMLSLFTSFVFTNKDRIIYEVGIDPVEENTGWVFCVCNKRDAAQLTKEYQDINFFCSNSEPSNMSDKLILYSESEELYCDLFQNKVI